MQRDRIAVARTWLRNAEEDRNIAVKLLSEHPARATFHAQQAAEMALKGALIARSDDHPLTHSVGSLVRQLRESGAEVSPELAGEAAALDVYYIASRYPDAVGDADPVEVVPADDARRAIARAERVIAFCAEFIAAEESQNSQNRETEAPSEDPQSECRG